MTAATTSSGDASGFNSRNVLRAASSRRPASATTKRRPAPHRAGHAVSSRSVGDQVLREIGAILRTHCRADDIPVRLGGDEFAVIFRADLATAAGVAERVRQVVDSRDWSDLASGLRVTLSMGGRVCEGIGGQELFDAADRHLYVAKQQGRNQLATASH